MSDLLSTELLANGAATTKMLGTILSLGVAVPAMMIWRSRRPDSLPVAPSAPTAVPVILGESASYRPQLQELGAIMPELVIETDPEGWIIFVGASSGRWSGLPAAEALEGTLLVDLVDNSQHPSFREFCTRVLKSGPQGPRVFRLRRPGNAHLPVRVVAAPLLEMDGRTARGIRTVFTDVSGELRSRRELDHRRTAANAVSDILRHIAAANAGELDEALTRALISVDGLTTIDRCFLGRLGDDQMALDWQYQWCSEDVEEIPQGNLMDSLENYPWLRERLTSGSVVHVEDVAALPRDAWSEKVQWLRHETRSALAVPMVSNDRVVGLLAFHSVRSTGGWRAEDINLLETVAGLLATAWQRRQDLEALQREQETVRRINADLEQRVARATSGLRSSEARYRRLIESLGDSYIFYSHDANGAITYISPSCRELLGYGGEEELRTAVGAWLVEPRNQVARACVERTLAGTRQPGWDVVARRKDGSEVILEIDAVPVFDAEGQVVSVEGVARDVSRERRNTELIRQTRQRLVDADKLSALKDMIAGLSHEINTPVGVGVTAASHLGAVSAEGLAAYRAGRLTGTRLESLFTDIEETAASIQTNLDRTAELLRSVRQVTVDQCSNQVRDFDLQECLRDVVRSLAPRFRGTGYELDLDCPEAITLRADPGAFYPVVTNLVQNSLFHGFSGRLLGRITLQVTREEDEIRLEYRDDGNGMDKEQLARIYEPFYTTRRGRGGMGLGMHIVYTNVTQVLGGAVSCASRPGRGVTFDIRIPLAREVQRA